MIYGYTNSYLRIDLANNLIKRENLEEKVLRKFIGGVNLGIKILYDEVPPGINPLGPNNRLIFVTTPLLGTLTPAACQYAVVTKSPLTGLVGIGRSKGFWGPALKLAGYDGIIIQGIADKPIYVDINNDRVQVKDASHLWGADTYTTEDLIKKELGNPKVRVLCIGRAGENLVKFSCIENDQGHVAGRCGVGTVMGSKKVKAIAVHGTGKVAVADPKRVIALRKKWLEISSKNPAAQRMSKFGTAGDYERTKKRHDSGDLPTKNLTTTLFPEWRKLSGEYIRTMYQTTKTSCFNCHIGHDYLIEISSGPYAGKYVGPEYEATAAFGSNLGISDTEAIVKLNDLANRYGIDLIECSWVTSLLMECYEKGVLSKEAIENIELEWGDAEAVTKIMEKIVNREGIGNTLAEGVEKTANMLGATEFASYINGMSPALHDLRHNWGWLIVYTIAFAGPTHQGYIPLLSQFSDIDVTQFPLAMGNFTPFDKGQAGKRAQLAWMGLDCLGICRQAIYGIPYGILVEFLAATTGWDMDIHEFFKVIERGITLARCFNLRNMPRKELDWPSERILQVPADGPAKGKTAKKTLKGMISEYYHAMGWEERTGRPSTDTLKNLDLEYAIPDIWG